MPAHWDTSPANWDACILGKFRLPGVASLEIKRGRKLDKKSAPGKNGASVTDKGGEGAEVTITLQMTTADEWDAWCAALRILDPTKVAPQAYDIIHPEAEAFQVQSVMVEKISSGKPDSGIKTIKIECTEWFAQPKGKGKSKVVTPTGAKGASNVLDMARDKTVAKNAAAYDKASGGQAGPPPPPSATGNTPTG